MELHYPLILDGSTGTQLQKRGYDGSVCAEAWSIDHPEVVRDFQKEYLQAGSQVLYSPTFGANRVKLEENGIIRVEVDDRSEKIGYKIREAQLEKVPYMLIVGDKDIENNVVAVRSRKDGDLGAMSLSDFIAKITKEVAEKQL